MLIAPHHLAGVRMGSRPIFVKDGFGARGEEERLES